MHYSNLVIIEATDDIDSAVERAMGPSEENGGFWDFFQIGGRWTGLFDGYDPEKDPANRETCFICRGTGTRHDWPQGTSQSWIAKCGGCNGCGGTGEAVKWPPQWARHKGDVASIESLTDEQYARFYRVVDGVRNATYGGDDYLPWRERDHFVKRERPPLDWLKREYPGHLAVIVDNHS